MSKIRIPQRTVKKSMKWTSKSKGREGGNLGEKKKRKKDKEENEREKTFFTGNSLYTSDEY